MTTVTGEPGDRYGSDVAVDLLASLGVEYVALNPGASIRGLHESLVHAGKPGLILALHEEVAVAVAHGYAKAAQRPMGVMVHDLVGLQHASMAIFNAWIDQVPMMLVGGSGPADTERRRAWIDWIHSPRWQSLTVRDIVKWDDEPRSLDALRRSLVRSYELAINAPQGPTYVSIDASLQEDVVTNASEAPTTSARPASITGPPAELEHAASILGSAERPAILTDLTGRSREAYAALIELADTIAAPVVDLGGRHNFPNDHWADLTDDRSAVLAWADLVLCLDLRDVTWGLSEIQLATHANRPLVADGTRVISIGLGDLLHRGFLDRENQFGGDLRITADTAIALPALVELLRHRVHAAARDRRREWVESRSREVRARLRSGAAGTGDAGPISPARIAAELWPLIEDSPWLLANGTLSGWARREWRWNEFGCYLGLSGGAGLGYGVGASIGAALALRAQDRLVIDLQADGDLLYTASGLWTAAHHNLPMLVVVQNNRSYGKDRLHQATMARTRRRGEDRVHIGIDIDDPAIDLGLLATSQGVEGIGPITEPAELRPALERGLRATREGRPALVDVVVDRS